MKKNFSFESDTSELKAMRKVSREFLDECDLRDDSIELLVLALDEACTNIIRYAYQHERKPVQMEMEKLPDRVRFILRDFGKRCDVERVRSRALEDIRPGGLGVHIIKQAFDHVSYEPQEVGTRLVLEKMLPVSARRH